MRKKILQNLLLLVLGSILITMLLGGALMYRNTINQVQQDLQQDVAYLRQNLLMEPGRLNFPSSPLTRITLIDTQGKVVYDSEANHDAMENHEHRPEVQAAQRDGHGSADRVSATVGKRDFYYAERLADGRILRVARSADDMFSTMISFIPWLVLMGLGIGFLAYLVAVRLTNKLIAPLEDVNLDQPLAAKLTTSWRLFAAHRQTEPGPKRCGQFAPGIYCQRFPRTERRPCNLFPATRKLLTPASPNRKTCRVLWPRFAARLPASSRWWTIF
jgi:hypothetical protein